MFDYFRDRLLGKIVQLEVDGEAWLMLDESKRIENIWQDEYNNHECKGLWKLELVEGDKSYGRYKTKRIS